jgi:hypothetical protein
VNRAFRTGRVPALAPHPVQVHRQLSRHRYFGNLPSAPHREVEESTAPLSHISKQGNALLRFLLWLASYRDLRCFFKLRGLIFVPKGMPQRSGKVRRLLFLTMQVGRQCPMGTSAN